MLFRHLQNGRLLHLDGLVLTHSFSLKGCFRWRTMIKLTRRNYTLRLNVGGVTLLLRGN